MRRLIEEKDTQRKRVVTNAIPQGKRAHGHTAMRYTTTGQCVACVNSITRKHEAAVNERRRRKADPRKHLWELAKSRAAKQGTPFTIALEDVPEIPTHCPVLGTPMTEMGNGFEWRDTGPSIDRIRPACGYVPGNIAIISYRANYLKRNAEIWELESLIAYMRRLT